MNGSLDNTVVSEPVQITEKDFEMFVEKADAVTNNFCDESWVRPPHPMHVEFFTRAREILCERNLPTPHVAVFRVKNENRILAVRGAERGPEIPKDKPLTVLRRHSNKQKITNL